MVSLSRILTEDVMTSIPHNVDLSTREFLARHEQ